MRRNREEGGNASTPLVSLYEISKILGSTLDLEKSLHDVLNILASYLDMRCGAVLVSGEDGGLAPMAVSGVSLQDWGGVPYPFQTARRVLASGVALVESAGGDDPALADYIAENEKPEDDRALFYCAPLKTTERPFGVLSVVRASGNDAPSHDHDLRILGMVATLIGQTITLHRKVAADRARILEDNARLQKRMAEAKPTTPIRGLEDVVGQSEAMSRVFAQVQQAAASKATILLRGESGTGKELVARAIHLLSPRAQKPFIKLNCAALAESVLESELFGHEKGAFTGAVAERKGRFELAHGGTLFLDEIGEISAAFQAKLLRVLQEGEFERVGGNRTVKVNVRLVAATNRDLETAVTKGEFRADLYYRLNVVPIFLPPLRERTGDIPLLASHFLSQFNAENGRTLAMTQRAVQALQRCRFPGNVRELENCICRTATMVKGDTIDETDLSCRRDVCLSATLWEKRPPAAAEPPPPSPSPLSPPPPPQPVPSSAPPPAAAPEQDGEPDDERERLIQAMEKCGWVQAKAARLLGLTPRQIGYALRKHGIEVQQL